MVEGFRRRLGWSCLGGKQWIRRVHQLASLGMLKPYTSCMPPHQAMAPRHYCTALLLSASTVPVGGSLSLSSAHLPTHQEFPHSLIPAALLSPLPCAVPLCSYSAHVELSAKVLDDVAKLERTLCHELCHVAAWLVNHTAKPPHGAVFKAWADRAMYFYPHLDITTCHQYDIFYPFRWQCTNPDCLQTYGRHSNSIDVARKVCGECRSRLAFLGRFSRDGSPAKQRAPSGFAAYVKENFSAAKAAAPMGTPQPEVMRRLGQDWAARQAQAGAAAGMAAPAGGPAAAAGGGGRQSTVASLLDELSLA